MPDDLQEAFRNSFEAAAAHREARVALFESTEHLCHELGAYLPEATGDEQRMIEAAMHALAQWTSVDRNPEADDGDDSDDDDAPDPPDDDDDKKPGFPDVCRQPPSPSPVPIPYPNIGSPSNR